MMTVLNTVEIMDPHPAGIAMIIFALVSLAICILAAIIAWDSNPVAIPFAILGIIFATAGIFTIIFAPEVPTGKFQIEATFTDDFSFTSVMKEYEVIDQRGDIFILEPKEREVG